MGKITTRVARYKRHARVRLKVKGASSKPRLCVFRSLDHSYVQIIDDEQGHTLVAASTFEPETKGQTDGKSKINQAELVGALLAKRAISKGIKEVAFDRGGSK